MDAREKFPDDRPFTAIVSHPAMAAVAVDAADATEAGWSIDEIEAAYLKALEAADLPELATHPAEDASGPARAEPGAGGQYGDESLPTDDIGPAGTAAGSTPTDTASRADGFPSSGPISGTSPGKPITARQIVEALLFVGGRPLPTRAIADVLGGSATLETVEELLSHLNSDYSAGRRPYEVQLIEGGYCLRLRSEFEKVRGRVFGAGPREVKLSQDLLEVLAFVAYQQPVAVEALAETGKKNPGLLVRQLLRRELIALNRGDDGSVTYETTGRFLDLFGLKSLNDLPRSEQLSLR